MHIKIHAHFHQPVDGLGAVAHSEFDHVFMTETGAGNQRIVDMRPNRIIFIQHRGNAALGIVCRALCRIILAEHHDLALIGQFQGQCHAGCATADNQDVAIMFDG